MKFQHSAFIRRNTPALRKKLEDLGIKPNRMDDDIENYDRWLITNHGLYISIFPECIPFETDIDCGTNESLFLAIAAIREDSDYMQWFYNKNGWFQCSKENIKYDVSVPACIISDAKKASLKELEEHFN